MRSSNCSRNLRSAMPGRCYSARHDSERCWPASSGAVGACRIIFRRSLWRIGGGAVASMTEVLERHPFPSAFARHLRARIPDHILVDETIEAPRPDRRMGNRNHDGFLSAPFQIMENRYEVFSQLGWDQLLVVSVLTYNFGGSAAINPPLSWHITLHISLVRTADGVQLGSFYARHSSGRKEWFTTWGADNARLFEEELIDSYEHLAAQVAEALAR
jgi:hypothetical protein